MLKVRIEGPSGEAESVDFNIEDRGTITIADDHGAPILRLVSLPGKGCVGLGIYGALGDFLYTFTIAPTSPGAMWDARMNQEW